MNDSPPSGQRDDGTASLLLRHPLLVVCLAVCLGIFLDATVPIRLIVAVAVTGASLPVWMIGFRFRSRLLAESALLVGFVGLGLIHHHTWWRLYPQDTIARFAHPQGAPVCLRGVVAREPRWLPPGPDDPFDPTPTGIRSQMRMQAQAIHRRAGWHSAHGNLTVYVDGQLSGLTVGDSVEIHGQLFAADSPRNPGEIDFQWYARARRQSGLLIASHPDCVSRLGQGSALQPWRWLARLRQHFESVIWRQIRSQPDLAAAVLLGIREYVDDEVRQGYLATGTIHLLAISGLHVGILAGFVMLLGTFSGVGHQKSLWITFGFVWLYCGIVDFQPPVLRASVLISIWCLGRLLFRSGFSFNSLAAAALIVLAINPTSLFQTGAQLSFLAFTAIIAARPILAPSRRSDPLDRLVAQARPAWIRSLYHLRKYFFELLVYGAMITLFAMPLVAMRFHLVAPIGILVNPLLMLPIAVVLQSGLLAMLFADAIAPLAAWAGALCGWGLNSIQWLVSLAGEVPCGHWYTPGPSSWAVAVFYLVLAGAFVVPKTRLPLRWGLTAALATIVVTWTLPDSMRTLRSADRQSATVTFIDVGHGGATLLELPNGQTVLFDAGSLTSPENAAMRISGVLWQRRVTHLDAVFISHADLDHFNALPRLTTRFSIGRVYASPSMIDDPSPTVRELWLRLRGAGISIAATSAGDHFRTPAGFSLCVIHPPPNRNFESDNARSLVVSLGFDSATILLTADIEQEGLELLMSGMPRSDLAAMAPHHGSRHSLPAAFAAWSGARWMVVCDDDELENDRSLAELARCGAQVLVTGRDGAVQIDLGRRQRIQTWRANRWQPVPASPTPLVKPSGFVDRDVLAIMDDAAGD